MGVGSPSEGLGNVGPERFESRYSPGERIVSEPRDPESSSRSGNVWERASQSGSGGQNSGTPSHLHIGRLLGERWLVGERIGSGGMAAVHAATDVRLGRKVAAKILHAHVSESPEARERLAREARAIAQLKHENIIEVYDYSSDAADCTWLVTELVEGCSLRQHLDRHERPLGEVAVMLTTEVLRALRAAHAVGIIHRDVKPDNILVGKEGRPKLSDFGIAKVLNESRMTMTGNLVGSPSYMSPEQADGLHTDHRTDLYSAGILLYRLVTGTLPFRGATPFETVRKVARGEYVDPVELAPDCAGPIAGAIRKALTVVPEHRYQSADEMLVDLGQILQDAGLSATWDELPRYFANPESYQAALKPRLAEELERRGRALLDAGEESRAVDCFNRAISLGAGNQGTLDLVRQLSRRRNRGRWRRALVAGALLAGVAGGIIGVALVSDRFDSPRPVNALASEPPRMLPSDRAPVLADTKIEVEAEQPKIEAPPPEPPPEPAVEAPKTEAPKPEGRAAARPERRRRVETKTEPPKPPTTETEVRALTGTLQVGTKVWVDIYVDGRRLGRAPDRSLYPLPVGRHTLRAVKPDSDCMAFEQTFELAPDATERIRVVLDCP